jgi:predicted permease
MGRLLQDARYAVRTLLRTPAFTVTAVLTLALGIGATTALFSVVNGVLLRSLPYPRAEQLVQVWQLSDKGSQSSFSDPNFQDIAAQNRSFERLAAYMGGVVPVIGGSEPTRAEATWVTRDFFSVLGVRPIMGRAFLPEEHREGAAPAVLVSYGYWQRYLGGNANFAGKTLTFDDAVYTVVGVMPPGFAFPKGTELWAPRELLPQRPSRTAHGRRVVGRLRDGVSLEQARQDVSAIARRLKAEYGSDTWMSDADVVPLRDQIVGRVRPALLVLLSAAAFLLVIACANVMNLLLARAAARQREFTVRMALGANRWSVARQFLTESLVLALAGGMAGVLLASWGVPALVRLAPDTLPRASEIGVNVPVFAFALAVSVLVAGVLGLLAALRATGDGVRASLAQNQRTQGGGGASQRMRGALVASQVALTLVLLVGAGLLGRSFLRLLAVEPGFRTTNTVTMNLMLPGGRGVEGTVRLAQFHEAMSARLHAIPGVQEVGGVNALPMGGAGANGTFLIVNRPDEVTSFEDWRQISRDTSRTGFADYRVANEGYFRAMAIPLMRGRLFDERDTPDAPHVAVISESLAKTRWPNEDPIGKMVQYGNMDGDLRVFTIVGIVGDVRDRGLDAKPEPTFYGNARQRIGMTSYFTYVMHGTFDPTAAIASARAALRELAPTVPPTFRTMEQVVSSTVADRRFNLILLGVFGGAALLLAVAGIYGVIAYLVAQQTREIGIRLALGAQRNEVLGMVVGRGVRLTVVGLAVGLLAAFWLTRLIGTMLFGIGPADPLTFGGISLLLLGVTALASYIPARRATKVDPMVALRSE